LPGEGRRSFTTLLTVAIIVIAAIVGVYVATRSAQTEPAGTQAAATPPPVPDAPPPMAKYGPHKQDQLPPLPYDPAPARSPDVVRAAYLLLRLRAQRPSRQRRLLRQPPRRERRRDRVGTARHDLSGVP
jgi:cell division protein FtsN